VAFEPVLSKNFEVADSQSLAVYRQRGGYRAIAKALQMDRQAVIDEVRKSNLRGRGGAGFPAGAKWSFLPADRTTTYLCVNADESEPGTFNNRYIMELDPHLLLEGILIAGYATRTTTAFIYVRVEYHKAYRILQQALDEAYAAGLFGNNILGHAGFSMDCYIHRGAGAYVCGEETGLIESLEGKRGWPRVKPPFPAVAGLFGKPTVVNNVETIACLVPIIERGAAWFASIGVPPGSTGPKLYTVSGPVKRPGCYEAPLGLTVRELVYGRDFGQGMLDGKQLKAVVPGGLSVGFLTADELDCKLDFEDPARYGLLGLGTAGAMVIDDATDLRQVLLNVARFYATESCGQCTQCREGTMWMYKIARRIAAGAGRIEDLDLIVEIAGTMGMMTGRSICGHADGAAFPVKTLITKFRAEFEERVRSRTSMAQAMAVP
jgi:NADH-quinone oxidoreductase subunit F